MSESTSEQSMYDRIGGGPAVKEAVSRFYTRLLDDNELAPYFASTDMTKLKQHQAAFLTHLLGGPNEYTGRDLASAHLGKGITSEHYDKTVAHLVSVLTELDVPADILEALGGVVTGAKPAIVADAPPA